MLDIIAMHVDYKQPCVFVLLLVIKMEEPETWADKVDRNIGRVIRDTYTRVVCVCYFPFLSSVLH